MNHTELDIKRWGNNLGVRIPVRLAREANLHVDQRVRVEVNDGRVIITPLKDAQPTLEQRLEQFDIRRHGGEVMLTNPVGAEH